VLILISGLAVLDAERATPDANIDDFGDALWWAATTVTTVGYGDRFPVSGTGRLVAVALMLVGISLFGAVAATVGAWFASLMRTAVREEEAATAERLQRIEERLDAMHAALLTKEDTREEASR
jgi:voltage-gated potassium channel